MILKRVRVMNFRCIDDSAWFSVGPVTCFVGKNESGKTALLQAIEKLKPARKDCEDLDKLTDYPRKWLGEYDERNPDEEAIALETEWDVDDSDVAAVEALLGSGALAERSMSVTQRYGPKKTVGLSFNDERILSAMAKASGFDEGQQDVIRGLGNSANLAEYVRSYSGESTPSMEDLKNKLSKFRDMDYHLTAIDTLIKRMPRFLYFSNYDRLSGRVSIDDLISREREKRALEEGQRLFMEFLQFAKISLEEIRDAKKAEVLRAQCEAASITISRQIFEYWSQNRNLKAEFIVEAGRPEDPPPFNSGFVMEARVRNLLHDMTVPFSDRSAGFVWFFSFLVHFSQVKKEFGNVIILLDEPGLALHARAQGDLLRYFAEKLKPSHQVLYTTHSPFMVPANDLTSVRTVEDRVVEKHGRLESTGTHVGDQVLSTDRDTLFPLQAALGFEITQTLFVGEHTLLVEGPSDYLYFASFSNQLKQAGREALDTRWTICPTGGVDKVPAFVSLFGGNKLDIVVVVDFVKGQKLKIESIKQSKLLKDGRVLTFADFVDQEEADVEDMLGPKLYASVLNSAYSLEGALVIDAARLGEGTKKRILPEAEGAFRVMPPHVREFNHYDPAAYLVANVAEFAQSPGFDDALTRFEKLFKVLNQMLK